MQKAFYLESCSTCKRILSEVELPKDVELREIKSNNITKKELDYIKNLVGSYEELFSKRAMKYKSLGLKEKNLSDKELGDYIVEEYTFLKRPVFVFGETVLIGNSKKTIDALKAFLNEK